MGATTVITFADYDLVRYDAMHVDRNHPFLRTVLLRLQDRRVSYRKDAVRSFLENYFKVVHDVHFLHPISPFITPTKFRLAGPSGRAV